MTCSVCGDSLNGTYFTFLNKLICERDYNVSVPELGNIDARYLVYLLYLLLQSVQKTCSECGCRISDVYYTLDSGKVVCEADYRVTHQHYRCYHGQPSAENPGHLQEVLPTCGGEAREAVRLGLPSPVFQLPGEDVKS